MKRKVMNKIISLFLAVSVVICTVCAAPTVQADAAVTAQSVLRSALSMMKSYDKITYQFNRIANNDGAIEKLRGMCMSDSVINYGFYYDNSQSDIYWEEYQKGKYVYRRRFSKDEWNIYTDMNYKKNSVESYSEKKFIEYMLGHVKKAKIVSTSTSSYTITAVPNFSTTIKSVRFTIDKKKKCVTSIRCVYKTYRDNYYDSSDTYLVKNQIVTYTHISYGKGRLHMPAGL